MENHLGRNRKRNSKYDILHFPELKHAKLKQKKEEKVRLHLHCQSFASNMTETAIMDCLHW
jgi:hypothetical protein